MIAIRPKSDFAVTVEAELTPELVEEKVEEVKKYKVYYGKELMELRELFEVTKEGDDKKLILDGDFSRVKWIGYRMSGGEIVVKGNVGVNCGILMADGKIVVEGNADDWIGAKMEGGEIVVKGSAGSVIGCAYYGDATGMSGGKITIEGNAGNYIGEKMAGGEIEIEGNAGDFIGTEMKDGSITIHGSCGFVGGDMKAGEIRIGGEFELVPTFAYQEDVWVGDVNVKGKGIVRRF